MTRVRNDSHAPPVVEPARNLVLHLGRDLVVDLASPIDCSRPIRFDGADPALFGADAPVLEPYRFGSSPARVSAGASVNVDRLELVPHCHGTHTETAGHLAGAPLPVSTTFSPGPVGASLVTIVPQRGAHCRAEAGPAAEDDDLVVTEAGLRAAIVGADPAFLVGLVLRIRVSSATDVPVYLTGPAARALAELGTRHLVVELPSIDRPDDGKRLAAHRAFWKFAETAGEDGAEPASERAGCTVTELALIPSGIPDGRYLLDLHLPNLATDAVPSRPVLYAVRARDMPPFPESP